MQKQISVKENGTVLNVLCENTNYLTIKITEIVYSSLRLDQFKHAFKPKAIEAFIKRMERNEGIASQIMSNEDQRKVALELMMMEVYERAQDRGNLSP
jgi:hypothetical protein